MPTSSPVNCHPLNHLAIIMDGNGRWAVQRGLPRSAGHQAGVRSVQRIVECCHQQGIQYLSLFAFSVANNRRPFAEVSFLMRLFANSLNKHLMKLHENDVCIRIIGEHGKFDDSLKRVIDKAQTLTAQNKTMCLTIALNYSGRWDIVQATKKLMQQVKQDSLAIADLDESQFQSYLSVADLPDPDLLIRTSGESRISNYLLWSLAHTELYFCPTLWPDFDKAAFEKALDFYHSRERRFGLTSQQLVSNA